MLPKAFAAPDPDGHALRRAARVLVVASVVFVGLGWVADLAEAAGPGFFAVFTLGAQADFGGTPTRRAARYLVTGAVGMGMLLLAAAVDEHARLAVATTGVVAFTTLFLGTLGGPFYAARFPVVVGFLYGVTSDASGSVLADRVLGWAVGALAITVASVVLWPARDLSPVPGLIADVLRRAARIVTGPGAPNARARLLDASHRLRIATNRAHLHAGAIAPDERRRAELVHATERLSAVTAVALPTVRHDEDRALITSAAHTLDACATAVTRGHGDAPLAPALRDAIEAHAVHMARLFDDLSGEPPPRATAADAAHEGTVVTDVRVVARVALAVAALVDAEHGITTSGSRAADTVDDRPDTALRAQLRLPSLWFRNALRAAVALMVAVALVFSGLGEDHGFWITLGAFTVLRADLATIGRSAWTTIIGTTLGFAVSSGVVLLSEEIHAVLWVAFVIGLFVAALGDRVRPELGAAAFTATLVTIYTLIEPAGLHTGEVRLRNVSIGVAVTLGVTLVLWPRPGRAPGRLIGDVVDRARRDLAAAVAGSLPAEPLGAIGDLDRVLDVVSTSAPNALHDDTRARVVVAVDVAATVAHDLATHPPGEPVPTTSLALAAESEQLRPAVVADHVQVDAALAGFAARLARTTAADPSPPPRALTARVVDALTSEPRFDPATMAAGIRTAAAFELMHRVASAAPRRQPTATGTLE